MEQYTSSSESGGAAKTHRETIMERRKRVLGEKSLTSREHTSKSPASGDKRRSQVLLAQRAHRQRTVDYITDLENEINRLRESEATLISTIQEKEKLLQRMNQAVETDSSNESCVETSSWDMGCWSSLLDPRYTLQFMETNTFGNYDTSSFDLHDTSEFQSLTGSQ